MIVFDLDNTLWTPELFQLRKIRNQGRTPLADKDVNLFPGARSVLESLRTDPEWSSTKLAIASRTQSGEWARDLLEQFGIADMFHYTQIFSGDKQAHFSNLKIQSGIPFDEMLFFDDNRDGKYGNCVPVSEMGVLSVHCPNGISTEGVFEMGVKAYGEWDGEPSTIVEWDGTVSNVAKQAVSTDRVDGKVKTFKQDRGFGFIQHGPRGTPDLFFHVSALPNEFRDVGLDRGDKLSFRIGTDKKGKLRATDIEVSASSVTQTTVETVNMHVFSMNLPFAALLANKYKTLETRNGTMFFPYEAGTKFLLHVGQRTYPDGNRHLEIMKGGGLSDEEIEDLKSLPQGFNKGMAVAILEIGDTFETTVEERSDPEVQRNVAAYGTDSGKMVTEIKRVEYLKRGVRVSGQGGVFKADVPVDAIPDGWL